MTTQPAVPSNSSNNSRKRLKNPRPTLRAKRTIWDILRIRSRLTRALCGRTRRIPSFGSFFSTLSFFFFLRGCCVWGVVFFLVSRQSIALVQGKGVFSFLARLVKGSKQEGEGRFCFFL